MSTSSTSSTASIPSHPICAITLTEPWATLIAQGLKTEEYRTWRTHYRGPLAIHAGRPTSAVLCIVDLVDITPTDRGDYAWHLTNLRVLPRPIPARGYPGLWRITIN